MEELYYRRDFTWPFYIYTEFLHVITQTDTDVHLSRLQMLALPFSSLGSCQEMLLLVCKSLPGVSELRMQILGRLQGPA